MIIIGFVITQRSTPAVLRPWWWPRRSDESTPSRLARGGGGESWRSERVDRAGRGELAQETPRFHGKIDGFLLIGGKHCKHPMIYRLSTFQPSISRWRRISMDFATIHSRFTEFVINTPETIVDLGDIGIIWVFNIGGVGLISQGINDGITSAHHCYLGHPMWMEVRIWKSSNLWFVSIAMFDYRQSILELSGKFLNQSYYQLGWFSK